MISQLIKELEPHLGSAAGFVVRDVMERLDMKLPPTDAKKKKLLIDVICDEVLHLSVQKTGLFKSKLYSMFDIKSYVEEFEYWR